MKSALTNSFISVGVDIGGTKIAAGLVDARGEILTRARTPMMANADAATALAQVKSAIDKALKDLDKYSGNESALSGIGICAPGPLDPEKGIIVNPPNLPCWRNFPLADELARAYGDMPVKVDNDANAAALAETQWGAGRAFSNIFYATIGTGIGTGIIFDRRIYHGRTGGAGEGGHMSIDFRGPNCACGKPGCIEVLAAGPAIALRARAKLSAGAPKSSAILDLAGGKVEAVSSEMVGQAFASGDALAKEILLETTDLLALWLSNVVDMLDPDAVIVGGGVAAMLSPFFDEMRGRIAHYCVNSRVAEMPLVIAHYGADSGIAGGAALVCPAHAA